VAGGLAGAVADVYPSIRARLTPTKALAAL
jgi:hypothetical protein